MGSLASTKLPPNMVGYDWPRNHGTHGQRRPCSAIEAVCVVLRPKPDAKRVRHVRKRKDDSSQATWGRGITPEKVVKRVTCYRVLLKPECRQSLKTCSRRLLATTCTKSVEGVAPHVLHLIISGRSTGLALSPHLLILPLLRSLAPKL